MARGLANVNGARVFPILPDVQRESSRGSCGCADEVDYSIGLSLVPIQKQPQQLALPCEELLLLFC